MHIVGVVPFVGNIIVTGWWKVMADRTRDPVIIASGGMWVAVLIPVQSRLSCLARGFVPGKPIPDAYWRLGKLWLVFGTIATLLPLAAIPVMVWKAG